MDTGIIIVALVVVFALGLIVGTRSQSARSCRHDMVEDVQNLLQLAKTLEVLNPPKKSKK